MGLPEAPDDKEVIATRESYENEAAVMVVEHIAERGVEHDLRRGFTGRNEWGPVDLSKGLVMLAQGIIIRAVSLCIMYNTIRIVLYGIIIIFQL